MGKPVKSFRAGAVEAAIFENERTVGGKKLKMSLPMRCPKDSSTLSGTTLPTGTLSATPMTRRT